jgi:hypothetical protein
MARYSFYTTDGPDKGTTFTLELGVTLLGRRDTAAGDDPTDSRRWVLTDPAVSRTHARIEWDGESAPVLVHLSSTNATLLDGKIVTGLTLEEGSRLSNGNKIRMGQTGFEVRQEESTPCRWCLIERGDGESRHMLEEHCPLEIDGVSFLFDGHSVKLALNGSDAEAYLLRLIDEQYWTTTLKKERSLTLKEHDVVQTEKRKLVLTEKDG